ncbi:MAG: hypothetical protein H6822_02240 [Planctomycetaceae bacterium]|nr:hypothetical protein [Planctomycetales bacterium]MCB9920970.1 hypothetical protein [Planctomycetaceae bacterium]
MIATNIRQEQSRHYDLHPAPQLQSVENSPAARCILIAEHRDEVFARLAHDLGAVGCVVFRATRAEEVPLVYAYSEASLAICNFDLPDATGWLTATKLRLFRASAQVWLYTSQQSACDESWARLSGVARMLYYGGDLFRLAEQVRESTLRFNLSRRSSTTPRWHGSGRLSHWEKTL